MTDNERLQAELDEARKLLNLAEDVILGFRSGAFSSDGCGEGIWARANDRAGLREMLGQRVGLGGNIWFDVSQTGHHTMPDRIRGVVHVELI
jgi:hypothetical protein